MRQPTKKRTGSGSRSKRKGSRFETELVDILNKKGVPSQRVLGSGSFVGAKSDVKIGVSLTEDGKLPDSDEGIAKMRLECKNRKDTPEMFWEELASIPEGILIVPSEKLTNEQIWNFLNQDAVSKAVVLRRAKVARGAVKTEDTNQYIGVFMGLDDWLALFKKAYGY